MKEKPANVVLARAMAVLGSYNRSLQRALRRMAALVPVTEIQCVSVALAEAAAKVNLLCVVRLVPDSARLIRKAARLHFDDRRASLIHLTHDPAADPLPSLTPAEYSLNNTRHYYCALTDATYPRLSQIQ
jgi:hypothetical protein